MEVEPELRPGALSAASGWEAARGLGLCKYKPLGSLLKCWEISWSSYCWFLLLCTTPLSSFNRCMVRPLDKPCLLNHAQNNKNILFLPRRRQFGENFIWILEMIILLFILSCLLLIQTQQLYFRSILSSWTAGGRGWGESSKPHQESPAKTSMIC